MQQIIVTVIFKEVIPPSRNLKVKSCNSLKSGDSGIIGGLRIKYRFKHCLLSAIFILAAGCSTTQNQLMLAANAGKTDNVKALIEAGADANAKNSSGFTALSLASFKGHTETVKALLDAGSDVNVKTNRGWTALKIAGHRGHRVAVRILKEAGAIE